MHSFSPSGWVCVRATATRAFRNDDTARGTALRESCEGKGRGEVIKLIHPSVRVLGPNSIALEFTIKILNEMPIEFGYVIS